MKKSIKKVILGVAVLGMIVGCNEISSKVSNTNTSSSDVTSSISSVSDSSDVVSLSSVGSAVVKTDIVLSAAKNRVEVNDQLTITSNVEGVTYTVTSDATVVNGVFTATKAGTYTVTAHKEGNYNDGKITIEVFVKTNIVLSTEKTQLDVGESVAITSTVEGVTYSTTLGASVENGVFSAYKEGTYTVTAHKDGDYNDGTITFKVVFVKTAAKVKAALQEMKTHKNYTVTGYNLYGEYKYYRTQEYFFGTQANEGQTLFTNIIPNTSFDECAHYIKLVNGELIIGNDVLYQTSSGDVNVATDIEDCDRICDLDIDNMQLVEGDGVFYTEDDAMFVTLASILGSQFVLYGDKIEFGFNKNLDLTVRVLFYDPSTQELMQDYVDAIGEITFTDIGDSFCPELEEALRKVSVSDTSMSEEVASSFMLKQGHIKSTFKMIVGENERTFGTSEYHFDEKYCILEQNIQGKVTKSFYEKDEEGDANYVGIGPDNKLVKQNYGDWGSFTFPFATLDLSDFRQTSEHTYSYMGYASHETACNLAWGSVGEDNYLEYITAKEENGKIVSFHCETYNGFVNTGDEVIPYYETAKYVIDVEVLPYETITAPAPFEADADTVKIGAFFDELNGATANFTMFVGNYIVTADTTTVKVTDKTILVTKYDSASKTYSYSGYHTLEDGVISFTATRGEDGKATAKLDKELTLDEGQTFASLLGLNVAPETMRFDEDGNIVFKEGVMNAGDSLFNTFEYGEDAIANTISYKVSGNHISNINFSFGNAYQEQEYAMLYGYGTTKLTGDFETDLVAKLDKIRDAAHPTSWKEESLEAYNMVLGLIGEDNIGHFAYVYDATYSGNFTRVTLNDTGNMVSIRFPEGSSLSFSTEYKTAFINACVATGMTKASNTKATYVDTTKNKTLTIQILASTIGVLFK